MFRLLTEEHAQESETLAVAEIDPLPDSRCGQNSLRARLAVKTIIQLIGLAEADMLENATDLSRCTNGNGQGLVELSRVPIHFRQGEHLRCQLGQGAVTGVGPKQKWARDAQTGIRAIRASFPSCTKLPRKGG
jgi:hypothetical protein